MNDITRKVTGGDLYSLWRVANITLPIVERVYTKQANATHEIDVPDDQKFGRCHPWWATICSELESALFGTSVTFRIAAQGINKAVDEYRYVDGDNAKGLNAVGEELNEILDNPNLHDKEDELTGDELPGRIEAPNWTTPEGWYDRD
ncbi:hypothetical protein [Stackebrandtia nassauensis]|uniref:Uncharacterized protein n=1 Tax=Stackebrandtia nassauensis (strain DSM 44728 / CIP 108903 / NRRL B-16338 / NBRC 102104 / LLR-40K-21) TaxID=446470 RepID=D3Q2B1_STANL|nr:hypothetical protein [Stackebrandtia nassauensis]ADD43844.1 hypothetical protein Snas_4194 [Stackebrandtia nassauensis DSM 44728]